MYIILRDNLQWNNLMCWTNYLCVHVSTSGLEMQPVTHVTSVRLLLIPVPAGVCATRLHKNCVFQKDAHFLRLKGVFPRASLCLLRSRCTFFFAFSTPQSNIWNYQHFVSVCFHPVVGWCNCKTQPRLCVHLVTPGGKDETLQPVAA